MKLEVLASGLNPVSSSTMNRSGIAELLKREIKRTPDYPHGPSVKWPKVYRGLRRRGFTKEEAARISNQMDSDHRGGRRMPLSRTAGEKSIPEDILDKRPDLRKGIVEALAKHGTHDQSSHGNWSRGMSGRQLSTEIRTDFEATGEAGFTVHHPTGTRPESGFAVAVPGMEQIVGTVEALTPAHINRYRQAHAAELAKPDTFLGAWVDTVTGQVYLDISVVLDDQAAAMEYGRSSDQIAIFDLSTFEEIRLDSEQRIAARRVPLVMA